MSRSTTPGNCPIAVRPALCAKLLWLAGWILSFGTGCAAITNPVANGIPVRLLPDELKAESKEQLQQVPLTWLRRRVPKRYVLGPGDILSIYIEGVLGERGQAPPVNLPESGNLIPTAGFPFPIRDDGTVALPLLPAVHISGLTIQEAQAAIVRAYAEQQILPAGRERIFVSLLRPRHIVALVIREDTPGSEIAQDQAIFRFRPTGAIRPLPRRGTGSVVELSAYENDVLTALTRTGGLPGSDAKNEVIVFRNAQQAFQRGLTIEQMQSDHAGASDGSIVRIPLKIRPGEPFGLSEQDITLQTGDIVFVQARETDLFYTGGLMPSGEFVLPRDYDLDVVEALAQIGGPLVNGGVNSNNLSGSIVAPGIGNPSPTLLTVVRRLPDGTQVPIEVDIARALQDPRENILVASGDILILQETPGQAFTRYFTNWFNFRLFSDVISRTDTAGFVTASVP